MLGNGTVVTNAMQKLMLVGRTGGFSVGRCFSRFLRVSLNRKYVLQCSLGYLNE